MNTNSQIKCKKCGETFDSSQNRCPNCMTFSKKITKTKKIILLIVGWFFIAWILNIIASVFLVPAIGIVFGIVQILLLIGLIVSVVLVATKKTPQ